jgi:hypothetical protein
VVGLMVRHHQQVSLQARMEKLAFLQGFETEVTALVPVCTGTRRMNGRKQSLLQ